MVNDSIPDLFDGHEPPPRSEYVLDQGFLRDPAYCQGLLPDHRMWPGEFNQLTPNSGRIRIDRALVFDIAQRAISEPTQPFSATQLHAAITFWGAPPGQSTSRAVKPLSDPNVASRLTDAINLVRGEGAASAYKALSRHQRLWVSGLGPSYFTKLMYFAGYGAKPYMPQPLIMDDNVITGLSRVTNQQWEASLDDYMRYIDQAKDWAYDFGTDPDVIERRLFEIGS